jgi:hypothetical protein
MYERCFAHKNEDRLRLGELEAIEGKEEAI